MNWLVKEKVGILFAGVFGILLITAVICYQHTLKLIETGKRVTQSQQVLTELVHAFSFVRDVETTQRGYQVSGDDRLLSPYIIAVSRMNAHLSRLKELTKDNHEHQRRIPELVRKIERRIALAEEVIRIHQKRRLLTEEEKTRADQGAKLAQEITNTIRHMETEENDLLSLRDNKLAESTRTTVIAIGSLGVLAFVLLCLAVYFTQLFVKERQLRLEEAEKAKANLDATLSSLAEGLARLNQEGQIEYLNPAGQRILGWELSEIVNHNFHQLVHDHKQEGIFVAESWCGVEEAMATRSACATFEERFLCKSGLSVIAQCTYSPLMFNQEASGSVLSFRDATEEKHGQSLNYAQLSITKLLAESEELGQDELDKVTEVLCKAFDWDMGLYWVVNPERELLQCAGLWHSSKIVLQEFHEEEIRGLHFVRGQGIPGEIWQSAEPRWITEIAELSTQKYPRIERTIKAGFHSIFIYPILVSGRVIGAIEFLSHEVRSPDHDLFDVCASVNSQVAQFLERKRSEAKLLESEEVFRQLAENIREVFWLESPDLSQLFYISPAYEEIWGLPVEDLYADPRSFIESIVPEDRDQVMQYISEITKSPEGSVAEYRITRPDGSIRWIWSRSFPIYDEDGNVFRTCGICHDISERKEIEKRISEFYSVVSHELRTPLTSIRAALGMIEGGLCGPLPEKATKLVEIARTESDRLIRLINDMLDLRKIEAGKLELHLEPCQPNALVDATLNAIQGMANEASVNVVSDVETDTSVSCDKDRIIQVLTNLVSNAVKFSQPGSSIKVKVETDDTGSCRFSVIDNGPGIAKEHMHKLFEQFGQVDSSESRAKGGTGLGLAVSKGLVEEHKGKIGVESKVGIGSTFWFELPKESNEASQS